MDNTMDKRKIILDCDPGHDDAVAIMMAAVHPSFDLLGITVVAGNQTLEKTSINALNVCQALNIDVPVYAGCGRPMIREKMTAGDIHGVSGLDGPVFEPLKRELEKKHAVQYLIDTLMASDGDITVVTTGPMTNVGMAMRMEPKIIDKIKEIAGKLGYCTEMKEYKKNPEAYPLGNIGTVSNFIRVAVTGKSASPDLYTVMQIIGYDRVIKRIDTAVQMMANAEF